MTKIATIKEAAENAAARSAANEGPRLFTETGSVLTITKAQAAAILYPILAHNVPPQAVLMALGWALSYTTPPDVQLMGYARILESVAALGGNEQSFSFDQRLLEGFSPDQGDVNPLDVTKLPASFDANGSPVDAASILQRILDDGSDGADDSRESRKPGRVDEASLRDLEPQADEMPLTSPQRGDDD